MNRLRGPYVPPRRYGRDPYHSHGTDSMKRAEIPPTLPPAPDDLARRLRKLATQDDATPGRVQRLELDGSVYWLKRPEHLTSLRWRIQKGDPRRAFDADLRGLRHLSERGVPVPELVDTGPDHFITKDAGPPLHLYLADATPEERTRAVAAAAETLAKLHHTGARHGRPKLRDICWDGETARLIDMERFRARSGAWSMGLDWVILLHSLLETRPNDIAAFGAAVRSYRATGPASAIAAGTRLMRTLGRASPFLGLMLRARPRNRELAAAKDLPHAFARV